jgi:hypothetical protein
MAREAALRSIRSEIRTGTQSATGLKVAFGGLSVAIQAFQIQIEVDAGLSKEEAEEPLEVTAILIWVMSPKETLPGLIADGEIPKYSTL